MRVMDAPTIRGEGRARRLSALRSRWASAGLVLLVAVLSVVGIVSSRRVSAEIDRAQGATASSTLYQQASSSLALQDAALDRYRITRLPAERTLVAAAGTSVTSALDKLAARENSTGDPEDAAQIAALIVAHASFEVLSGQVLQLVDAGQDTEASQLVIGRLGPLRAQAAATLTTLGNEHQATAASALRVAHRDGALLRWGTPIAFGLTLLTIFGLSRVTRGHRRVVQYQALHDALTGLPNRLLFGDRATQMVAAARRSGAQPVVMMLDLDHFKEVNDTLGHQQGDNLLVQFATRVGALVRPGDSVARLGGDEFAVLLGDGGPDSGTQAAARILGALEEPFNLDGVAVGVEASIGIAACVRGASQSTSPAEVAAELLQQADAAMYQAKADRCGYTHFMAGSDQNTFSHLALLGELRQAFERDELVLHYQPKVATDTGELIGVEALVRWQHPTRGLLPPGEFIGLAEGTTLIHRLTTVVVDKALRFSRTWLDQGVHLPVAVNVSARSLLDKGFAANIVAQLTLHHLPPGLLWIELTEGTIMADPDKALAILTELRAAGVRLSIDDFGTGYSSMAYLKDLPVDELKVDRSFVKGMTSNGGDAVLVQSAIDLGHNLGLSVVAEGVEDDKTLTALKNLGADVVQGYYLGRPMTETLLMQWIAERAAGDAALPV
jgi:diguanylate cyclase